MENTEEEMMSLSFPEGKELNAETMRIAIEKLVRDAGTKYVTIEKGIGVWVIDDIVKPYDEALFPNRFFSWADTITMKAKVGADREDLIQKLDEKGIYYEKQGRSGFASRNSIAITDEDFLPEQKKVNILHIKDVEYKPSSHWGLVTKIDYFIEKDFEFKSYEKINNLVKKIKKEVTNEKIAEIQKEVGKGACLEVGGDSKYEASEIIKAGYEILFKTKTKNTADHRQNRSHTEFCGFVKKGERTITISVPDEYKGMAIGKGGSNIKSVQEKIGGKIVLGEPLSEQKQKKKRNRGVKM